MREILETSMRIERQARDLYRALAQTCDNRDLAKRFLELAEDETKHLDWWADLLVAWGTGLLPDILDEHSARTRLAQLEAEIAAAVPEDYRKLSCDQGLDLAVNIEFRLLDPIFSELFDIVRPGSSDDVHESYVRHVQRVVQTLEEFYSQPAVARFYADVLVAACEQQGGPCTRVSYDALTGLYTRRELLHHMEQELAWSKRYGRPLGVAVFDLDQFRDINEEFGPHAADAAISYVATTLKSTLRASDTVGRFGGDEFLVLAPETDGAGLESLMNRVVSSVRTKKRNAPTISVTAGASWAPGGLEVGTDLLLAQADRSMHAAKEAGRDRAGSALSAAAP